MPLLLPFGEIVPDLDSSVFIAETAVLSGDVRVKANVGIWYGTVARGDVCFIEIGQGSNVQDLTMLHVSHNNPLIIGENVTVGHHANLHGCRIGSGTLIGIGAIVLDGAIIGEGCLVAAGSLVPPRMEIPAGSFVIGSPAKVKRHVSEQEALLLRQSAEKYREYAQLYKKQSSTALRAQ